MMNSKTCIEQAYQYDNSNFYMLIQKIGCQSN